jgi:hypothetical protein
VYSPKTRERSRWPRSRGSSWKDDPREREREIFARYTQSVAALLAEETEESGDDIDPWVVANALIGVHRALLEYVRRGSLADRSNPDLSRDVRVQGERAFALLERGLGDYAIKRTDDSRLKGY